MLLSIYAAFTLTLSSDWNFSLLILRSPGRKISFTCTGSMSHERNGINWEMCCWLHKNIAHQHLRWITGSGMKKFLHQHMLCCIYDTATSCKQRETEKRKVPGMNSRKREKRRENISQRQVRQSPTSSFSQGKIRDRKVLKGWNIWCRRRAVFQFRVRHDIHLSIFSFSRCMSEKTLSLDLMIKKGDLIFAGQPFAFCLLAEYRHARCDSCFKLLWVQKTCIILWLTFPSTVSDSQ